LRPGPWLKRLKESSGSGDVVVDGVTRSLDELRKELVVETPATRWRT
jgi:hypothetical protein